MKQRNLPLRGLLKKSPVEYDFTKKKEFGEGKIGKQIVKAVTPKNIAEIIPTTKAIKMGKSIYNYFTS